MKIIITADIPEDITESEEIVLYDILNQFGANNIRVEVKDDNK